MFDRVRNSWGLMREAWQVLREDRELLLFPIVSGICSLLALATFAAPVLWMIPWGEVTSGASGSSGSFEFDFGPWGYLWAFLYYLVTYFIVVFFNSALVACVRIRLLGGDPTVRDGFRFAAANVGIIFQWALLSATVGTILKTIEERVGWLGQIVVNLIGLAWTLATAFAVPVLVHEKVGPFQALKRSAQTFRQTWGETVVANVGLGLAFGLLSLAAVPVMILAIAGGVSLMSTAAWAGIAVVVIGVALCFAYWIGLTIVQSTLQSIFLTACYQYAISGEPPSGFSPQYITEAWRPKKK